MFIIPQNASEPTNPSTPSTRAWVVTSVIVLAIVVTAGIVYLRSRSVTDGLGTAVPMAPIVKTSVDQKKSAKTTVQPAAVLPKDSDGDGIPDEDEIHKYHTDPQKADTDGDGVSDFEEIFIRHTDPLKADNMLQHPGVVPPAHATPTPRS